ncbi:MAG: arginine deiminase-related protein [Alphaproteobacteria bacterium]|nr:arginine deiminase-related protein [Alphaproteobacteria bacterium]
MSKQKILMCAPDHFGIDYVINPWMEGNRGNSDRILAIQQWANLKNALAAHTDIAFVAPQNGLPDQVFTANAGMVIGNQVVVSRFRARERQGEEPIFHDWFKQSGFTILSWPENVFFEGAGDALLDRGQKLIWAGYGFRSDAAAPALVEKFFGRRTIGLHLVDPRFYHLDTCLCPLEGGYVMYFPAAFDEAGQKAIAAVVPPEKQLIVDEPDALKFACNAVDVNRHVFINDASESLQNKLRKVGFTPVLTPLSEFMKSGGAAKCLTLKLKEDWG